MAKENPMILYFRITYPLGYNIINCASLQMAAHEAILPPEGGAVDIGAIFYDEKKKSWAVSFSFADDNGQTTEERLNDDVNDIMDRIDNASYGLQSELDANGILQIKERK